MSTKIKELIKPGFKGECDWKIFNYGETVALITGGSAKLIERYVKEVSELSGCKVDWHYVGGRAVIKTMSKDTDKVKEAIEEMTLTINLY